MAPEWADFFVAEVGASAALAGLLFVGISLNLAKIIGVGGLPDRALQALVLLIAALIVGLLMLMPEQHARAIGLEDLGVGAAVLVFSTALSIRSLRRTDAPYRGFVLWNIGLLEVAVAPYLIGGVLVLTGGAGGLYWIAAAICLSLFKAVSDSWVLLVEINR